MSTHAQIDIDQFLRDLDRADSAVRNKGMVRGLAAAGIRFAERVLEEAPKAPELTSALRSSISVFVNNALKWTSLSYRKGGRGAVEHRVLAKAEGYGPNDVEAVIIVNAPYATFQHETYHPGYVTAKLGSAEQESAQIVADHIDRAIREG